MKERGRGRERERERERERALLSRRRVTPRRARFSETSPPLGGARNNAAEISEKSLSPIRAGGERGRRRDGSSRNKHPFPEASDRSARRSATDRHATSSLYRLSTQESDLRLESDDTVSLSLPLR